VKKIKPKQNKWTMQVRRDEVWYDLQPNPFQPSEEQMFRVFIGKKIAPYPGKKKDKKNKMKCIRIGRKDPRRFEWHAGQPSTAPPTPTITKSNRTSVTLEIVPQIEPPAQAVSPAAQVPPRREDRRSRHMPWENPRFNYTYPDPPKEPQTAPEEQHEEEEEEDVQDRLQLKRHRRKGQPPEKWNHSGNQRGRRARLEGRETRES
jgi:hypothetical protein